VRTIAARERPVCSTKSLSRPFLCRSSAAACGRELHDDTVQSSLLIAQRLDRLGSSPRLEMPVTDDGKGFAPPKDISDQAMMGKLGLLGMYERARLLGGSFHIRSEPNQGTTVAVELPVANVLKAPG